MVTRVFIYYFTYQQTYIYCKNVLDCNSESEIVESLLMPYRINSKTFGQFYSYEYHILGIRNNKIII